VHPWLKTVGLKKTFPPQTPKRHFLVSYVRYQQQSFFENDKSYSDQQMKPQADFSYEVMKRTNTSL